MSEEKSPQFVDLVTERNWFNASVMGFLLVLSTFVLSRSILHLLLGKVDQPHQLPLIFVLPAICYFLFTYSLPPWPLKIAFLLLGIDLAASLVLAYTHVSMSAQLSAAIPRMAARQIALTIIVLAIVRWFKSFVRQTSPAGRREVES